MVTLVAEKAPDFVRPEILGEVVLDVAAQKAEYGLWVTGTRGVQRRNKDVAESGVPDRLKRRHAQAPMDVLGSDAPRLLELRTSESFVIGEVGRPGIDIGSASCLVCHRAKHGTLFGSEDHMNAGVRHRRQRAEEALSLER